MKKVHDWIEKHLRDRKLRYRIAWGSFYGGLVLMPIGFFVDEPFIVFQLSCLAVVYTGWNIIVTTELQDK